MVWVDLGFDPPLNQSVSQSCVTVMGAGDASGSKNVRVRADLKCALVVSEVYPI